MTEHDAYPHVRGSLRSDDGAGAVRLVARLAAGVAEVWSALTEPARLGAWLGEVDGDLRPEGRLRGHWLASGWEGTIEIQACEPERRLLLSTHTEDGDGVVEIALTADGDDTVLVLEDRGLPVDQLAAYGAGDQIHVEDLAAHLIGQERCDARARFLQLHPPWQDLAEVSGTRLPG